MGGFREWKVRLRLGEMRYVCQGKSPRRRFPGNADGTMSPVIREECQMSA